MIQVIGSLVLAVFATAMFVFAVSLGKSAVNRKEP